MKQFLKKQKYAIFSFLLPLAACFFICVAMGIWPFGDSCLLHIDMYHQYCPFFTEFAEKLKSGGSLFYTWHLGLGSDYISLYAYYLASPLNWFLLLFPSGWMIEIMSVMEILKISACGLTMFIFLRDHGNLNGLDEKKKEMEQAAVVFGLAYALCGFIAAYSWDVMWLDSVALAPLILLGLEKLVKNGEVRLYTITLAVSIWANYYISIMICIFVVFYFGWLFFTHDKKGKAVLRFAVYSLLAGGMSAVLLLPELVVLGYSGSSVGSGFPEAVEWYFNIFAEIGRMCTATTVYTGATDHWPNLYCGAFCLLLIVLYGFNRKIELSRKIPAFLMLAFFVVSFANNYLDFIWHGFHFPQSLPGRQSFLFAFLTITMSFECWKERAALKKRDVFLSVAIVLVLLGVSMYFGDSEVSPLWCYGVTALFIALYLVLALVEVRVKAPESSAKAIGSGSAGSSFGRSPASGWKGILLLAAAAELIINMSVTGFYTVTRSSYIENNADYKILTETAEEEEDGDFYRLEDVERLTKNDSSYHTYSSATVFSSLMNLDISHFYQSVYMEGGKNYYCYNGATPLTSAMLGVDYIISKDKLPDSDLRTLVKQSGNLYLYRNEQTLSVGYIMPDAVVENWDNAYENSEDRIGNLNELAALLGAGEDYLERVDFLDESENIGTTSFTIPEDGYYYAGYVNNSGDVITMSTSTGYARKFSKASHRYLLDLGQCTAGETISLNSTDSEQAVSYRLYKLNEDAMQEAYSTLSAEQLQVTKHTDTSIEGSITTDGGRLVLSVPYVPGWTLYVDGEETEITAFCDAFISVPLTAGTHDIRLVYKTPYLGVGAAVSAFSLGLFLILLLLRRLSSWKRRKSAS